MKSSIKDLIEEYEHLVKQHSDEARKYMESDWRDKDNKGLWEWCQAKSLIYDRVVSDLRRILRQQECIESYQKQGR